MKDINYLIGRLHGLEELVKILKDLADKKNAQSIEIVSVIADHISAQLEAILGDFDNVKVEPSHKEALSEIKEKHEEKIEEDAEELEDMPPREQTKGRIEKHEKTVDELLRDLENLKR